MSIAYNKVAESSSVYKTGNTIFQIDPDNLETYIDQALPQKKIIVDSETIYVCDLTHMKDINYNSLVLQRNGDSLKSMETTKQVMQQYFDNHTPYIIMQQLGKIVDISSKCPYVYGTTIFVPEKGPSKQSVNWIALHHMKHFSSYENQTVISFVDKHEITVNLTVKKLTVLFEQAIRLYYLELKMYKEMELLVGSAHALNPDTFVYRKTRSGVAEIDSTNVLGLHATMVHIVAIKMFMKAFEVADSYFDDIKEAFPLIDEDFDY